MNGVNKVILIGNLGSKPELKGGSGDAAVARLRVATSHSRTRDGAVEQQTEWHDVVTFGKLAEQCAEFLDKGRQVYVEGRLASNSWQDKEGNKRMTREIIARRVNFLSAPRDQQAA